MEWLDSGAAFFVGIILRLAIPVGATILLVWFFRRLDERWQSEAEFQEAVMAKNPGCWKVNQCSASKMAKCQAYNDPSKPCWQHFRESNGRLQERCLGCDVFRKAPIPIPLS